MPDYKSGIQDCRITNPAERILICATLNKNPAGFPKPSRIVDSNFLRAFELHPRRYALFCFQVSIKRCIFVEYFFKASQKKE